MNKLSVALLCAALLWPSLAEARRRVRRRPRGPSKAELAVAQRLLTIVTNGTGCVQQRPLLLKVARSAAAKRARWVAASAYAVAASCAVRLGQIGVVEKELKAAVRMGLDDCWYFRNDAQIQKVSNLPAVAALMQKVRMSRADYHEANWHATEALAVLNDTKMMILENMHRQDTDLTTVPQSTLPTRSTQNRTVLGSRVFLLVLQRYQRAMVLKSDRSRIRHLRTMGIIRNMPGGRSRVSVATIQQSRQQARLRAQRRQLAVQQRAYRPGNRSNVPLSCDKL